MKTNYEVAVIGGGIIGCSIAYYLAKEKMMWLFLREGKLVANQQVQQLECLVLIQNVMES